jgi:hypothetical protein
LVGTGVKILMFVISVVFMMSVGRTKRSGIGTSQPAAEFQGNIFIHGTRVGLLLLHTQAGQHVEDDARFYFKLPRQLIDPDFLHRRELLDNSLQLHTLWPISPIYPWYQI